MLDEVSFFLTKKIHKKERRKIFLLADAQGVIKLDALSRWRSVNGLRLREPLRLLVSWHKFGFVGKETQCQALAPYPIYGLNTMVEE